MPERARLKQSKQTAAPLIELHHCTVQFGTQRALDAVSFSLQPGQRWVLTGANGAGKSVLLKLLRGDCWPTPTDAAHSEPAMRVYRLAGRASREPEHHKRHIGYLAPERQDKYVRYDWKLTVLQVVTTGLFDEDIPLTRPTSAQRQRVTRLLRQFRLWSLRERRLLELSYGQRRRVLLARLLAGQPTVMLLDEVFNGLDERTRVQLLHLLEREVARTWILAVHSAQDIPASATHLLHLRHGQITYAGPLQAAQRDWVQRDQQQRHRQMQRQVRHQVESLPAPRRVAASVARQPLLRLSNVALFRDYRPVLTHFDWQVEAGEHWAVMGANGSGKSTLLMLLYGDLHPAQGGLIERQGCPRGTPIAQWKQRVGYVSPELQADYYLSPSLEHIVASGRYASIGLNQPLSVADRRAVKPWLAFFGLMEVRQRGPRQVSYGQLRLALLARALVNRPQLLLLDEPFTGLDPEQHAFVRAALQQLAQTGVQLIMAVHETEDLPPAVTQVLRIGPRGRVQVLQRT